MIQIYQKKIKKRFNQLIEHIWNGRKFNGDKINHKVKVTSIFNLTDADITLLNELKVKININEGFVLVQSEPIAAFFDLGILVKINDISWKLYLIQITKKKDAQERLTLVFLNDFFAYFDIFLKEKCKIKIAQNYFCYIFDENSKDQPTVNYCIEKK